eukprot:353899-Pleurochrysis_carterae.AAC.1
MRGLRDWYAPVSTKPAAADVAWESVFHAKGQTSVTDRAQYRHECEMRDPRMMACAPADEMLPWRR